MKVVNPTQDQTEFRWRVLARRTNRLRRSRITPGINSGADSGVPTLDRQTGGGTPPLYRMLRGVLGATASILIIGVLVGCGSDTDDSKPETTPSATSQSPEPSVAPPPSDAPDLDEKQQRAYDKAVATYSEFQDLVAEVGRDPKVTKTTTRRLMSLATYPAIDDFSDGLDDMIDNNVHVEGSRNVEWNSPKKVTASKVVFKQCRSPGDWAFVKQEQRDPQTTNRIREVTVIKDNGKWFVKDDESTGKC